MSEYLGTGPDGSNLLGFFCSVGVLATCELRWPKRHPRMRWERHECWRPVWSIDGDMANDKFIAGLHLALSARRSAAEFIALDRLPAPPEEFAAFARAAAESATPRNRVMADFVAAFGTEITRRGEMQDTVLRTSRSHEFLRFLRDVHDVTETQVREAMFGPWTYSDPAPTLRYDSIDDRRGALKASDPSKADIWTVRGANALAAEALRFFPCVPSTHGNTAGFSQEERCFTWPIWTTAVTTDVLRSLLNLAELRAERPDRMRLRALGVAEVFRASRVNNGRYRNFTPASPI